MALSCKITKSKAQIACKDVVSGIRNIYLINFDDAYPVGESTDPPFTVEAQSQIITIMNETRFPTNVPGTPPIPGPATAASGKVFQFAVKNTGDSFQQTIASSRDNGTTSFTQVLTFILTRLSAEMEYELKVMAWGRPILIAELNTGQFIMLGKNNGCEITGTSGVGGAIDSLNGYTMTATATERSPIFYLSDIITAPGTKSPINVLLDAVNTDVVEETETPGD